MINPLKLINDGVLDPRITFTRASSATRVNEQGLIEVVADDVPRVDYNPSTLAVKGLLIEEARTNTVLDSTNPYSCRYYQVGKMEDNSCHIDKFPTVRKR